MIDIYVITQLEGIHSWPEAPDEVAFLKFPHRHIFHIKVGMRVIKTTRELEFFIEKKKLEEGIRKAFPHRRNSLADLGPCSCEYIARQILDLHSYYSWVEVSEDGENGCIYKRGE